MEGRLLQSLAKDVGAVRHQKKPDVLPFDPAAIRASIDESSTSSARVYLAARRRGGGSFPSPDLRHHRSLRNPLDKDAVSPDYSQRELDMAIDIAVENGESLSTIAGLIRLGANSDLRITLLEAASAKNLRLLKLLLAQKDPYGQEAAVDAALSNTLSQLGASEAFDDESEMVVDLLLSADGNVPQVYFDKAVSQQQTCLVELLLRSRRDIPQQVISRNLWAAARAANYKLTSMLLAYGADASATTALVEVTKAKRLKLAVALVVNAQQRLPSPQITTALKAALAYIRPAEDSLWLKLFLYAGADGTVPESALRLRQAVAARDLKTIALLASYRAPITFEGQNALDAAIRAQDCGIMQLLLQSPQRTPHALGNLLPIVMDNFPTQNRLEPARLLLDAGATGPGVNEALLALVQTISSKYAADFPDALDTTMLEILVTHGANIDWKNGTALSCALAASNKHVFKRLYDMKPNEATRSAVLASCYATAPRKLDSTQADMALCLVRDGVEKAVLDSTLTEAVRYDPTNARLIAALVDYGAELDRTDVTLPQLALKQCTPEGFAAIIRGVDVRSPAVPELLSKSLAEPDKAKLLLARGFQQEDLDSVLATEFQRENIRHEAIDMLLGAGARIDNAEGDILGSICLRGDLVAMERVLRSNPSPDKVGQALHQAILSKQPCRYQIVELLLQSGAEQSSINECLALAICEPSDTPRNSNVSTLDKDDRLSIVKLLLSYGADVNHGNGAVLKLAVLDSNMSLISVLCRAGISEDVLWLVFRHASSAIDDHDTRHAVFQRLLPFAKTRRSALHDALVDLGLQRSQCLHLWSLLLDNGASVNHINGEVVVQTVKQQNLAFLPLLLEQNPSPEVLERSMSAAFELTPGLRQAVVQKLLDAGVPSEALDVLLDRAVRMQDEAVTRLILSRHAGASGDVLGKALIGAMDHSPNLRWSLIETLFDSCASQPDKLGDALYHAVEKRDVELIRFALKHNQTPESLGRALAPAMKYEADLRLATARMLLEAGAEGDALDEAVNHATAEHDKNLVRLVLKHRKMLGPRASEAIATAAVRGDVPILTCLLAQSDDQPSTSRALDAMTDARTVFEAKNGFACANMLLKKGVRQSSLDKALTVAVDDTVKDHSRQWFIDALVENSADVNAFDGKCVRTAAEHGKWELFDQLVAAGATSNTVSQAVCPLISSGMEEDKLVDILRQCFAKTGGSERMSDGTHLPAERSATFLALKHYPRSLALLTCLLANGCSLTWTDAVVLDEGIGAEQVGPLLWCLSSEEVRNQVSEEVLKEVIQCQDDVNSAAEQSNITPLMVAATNDLSAPLDNLLACRVDVNAEDHQGRTALWYASHAGSTSSVRKLCASKARPDDGSIQEAAKNVSPEIVEILLEAGHHPDYPSDLHQGRSALFEVLLNARKAKSHDRRALAQTLQLLLSAKADPTIEYEGKTAVYCALSSPRPVEMLSALLTTGEWQRLNDEHNLFTDTFGRKYSPTQYIEQGIWEGKPADREPLLKILRQKRCKDRYFATKGDQPPDAVGVPLDLIHEERARKALKDQHRLQLKMAQQAHARHLELQQQRHDTALQQDRERDTLQAKMTRSKYSQMSRHEQQLASQRQAQTQEEYDAAISRHKEITSQLQHRRVLSENPTRLTITDGSDMPPTVPPKEPPHPLKSNGLSGGGSQSNRLRPREVNHEQRIKMERQLLKEQEEAAKRQTQRRMEEIERQDESVKLRNKLVLAQIDARTKAQAALHKAYGKRVSTGSISGRSTDGERGGDERLGRRRMSFFGIDAGLGGLKSS